MINKNISLYLVVFVATSIATLGGLFYYNNTRNDESSLGFTALHPMQGGTGTTDIPVEGYVLVGTAGGVYSPVATSTLGIVGTGGGSQTPWTSAINGAGYALSNVGAITGTYFTSTSTTANMFPNASSTNLSVSGMTDLATLRVSGESSASVYRPLQYNTGPSINYYKLGSLSGDGARVKVEIIGQNTYSEAISLITTGVVSIGNADDEYNAWQYSEGEESIYAPSLIYKDAGVDKKVDVYVKLGTYFRGSVLITNAYGFTLGNEPTTSVSDPSGVTATDKYTAYSSSYAFLNGNVGISSSSPYAKLSVTNTGTAPSFIVEDTTSPDATPFVIDASGNVAIQRSLALPNSVLTVGNGLTSNQFLSFQTDNVSDTGINFYLANGTDVRGYVKMNSDEDLILKGDTIRFNTESNDNTLVISETSGRVGIGNGSPSASFDIQNDLYFTSFPLLWSTFSGQEGAWIVGESGLERELFAGVRNDGATSTGMYVYDSNGTVADRFLALYTNKAERLRIDSSGNVGIGTTSPYSKLSVAGQVVAENYVATSTTATSTLPQLTGSYFSGFGLSSCVGTTNKITWADGTFRCETDQNTGGGSVSVATSTYTVCALATCDFVTDGTADEVQINQAISIASTTGGIIRLFAQDYNLSAAIDLAGYEEEGGDNPQIRLLGAGIDSTNLNAASNVNAIETSWRAKYEIAHMTIAVAGTGDGIHGIAGTERGNWQSHVHDIFVKGDFTSHTGWGIDMESPFRMRFTNIEMNGVANGINLHNHVAGFNSGNLSLDRIFIDLWNDASNATSTGLRIAVAATTSTDTMNLVTVNRLDVYGGSALTNSIGVHIEGSLTTYGDSRQHSFNSMNMEDVKYAYKLERGRDNTFTDMNYTRVLTGGAFIWLDAESKNNKFENLYLGSADSATINLILDANTDDALPNILSRVTGWSGSGVTYNATIDDSTILEHINISGGSPTIDADITNRINTRTWLGGIFSSWLKIPQGTAPTVDSAGEIALDTTDNQLLVGDSGGTAFVAARKVQKMWSVTVASTSQAFIDGGLLPVPTEIDGYTITAIRCKVDGGTSKVVAVEDASANSSEDITCGTSVTSDDGSITNATVTAAEEMYIDFGATSGSVNYVTVSVFGTITRE